MNNTLFGHDPTSLDSSSVESSQEKSSRGSHHGDPQQRNEMLGARIEIFRNAHEGGCGWHIEVIVCSC